MPDCQMSETSAAVININPETTEHDGKTKSKPHNGKSITKMAVSPKGKYLVTYSKDDCSIVGWNINSIDEGQLRSIGTVKTADKRVEQICVSDDKKLVYTYDCKDVNDSKFIGKQ
jgi:WD40 repeat protein